MGMVDMSVLYPNGVPSLSVEVDAHWGTMTGYTTTAYSTISNGTWAAGAEFQGKSFNKEKKPMVKYYKVVKDHPVYEVGCILQGTGGDYSPTDDLFVKDIKGLDYTAFEGKAVVENSDWFERVYKVDSKSTTLYLSKTDAQATQTAATTSATPSA